LVLLPLLQREVAQSQTLPQITDRMQGDNGVGPGSYSQALFQSTLWDPAVTPIQKGNCTSSQLEVVSSPGVREPDLWRASCSSPMESALPS